LDFDFDFDFVLRRFRFLLVVVVGVVMIALEHADAAAAGDSDPMVFATHISFMKSHIRFFFAGTLCLRGNGLVRVAGLGVS
jgi:hypothetical protein